MHPKNMDIKTCHSWLKKVDLGPYWNHFFFRQLRSRVLLWHSFLFSISTNPLQIPTERTQDLQINISDFQDVQKMGNMSKCLNVCWSLWECFRRKYFCKSSSSSGLTRWGKVTWNALWWASVFFLSGGHEIINPVQVSPWPKPCFFAIYKGC